MIYFLYDTPTHTPQREPLAYGYDYHALLDMLRRQDAGRIVDDYGQTVAHQGRGVLVQWSSERRQWSGEAVNERQCQTCQAYKWWDHRHECWVCPNCEPERAAHADVLGEES